MATVCLLVLPQALSLCRFLLGRQSGLGRAGMPVHEKSQDSRLARCKHPPSTLQKTPFFCLHLVFRSLPDPGHNANSPRFTRHNVRTTPIPRKRRFRNRNGALYA